jgi:hypothetical protein
VGQFIIGIVVGLLAGIFLTGFLFVRRILQAEKFDPFSSDDPALARELNQLRGCVHRHIYLNVKHRYHDTDPPATRGADALRWLYLRDGVIFFENGIATVPSGEQVNFAAVVSRIIPHSDVRQRMDDADLQETAQAAVAAEMAASIVDRARRSH